MKQRKLLILIFLLSFFPVSGVHAQIVKMCKVGKMEARIYDHGCQSSDVYSHSMVAYFRGSYVTENDAYVNDWPGGLLRCGGMLFGARNWEDTTGYTWDAMISGHNTRLRELEIYQFAVPAEDGLSIHRYYRYPRPEIIVNGVHTEDPFVFGDEVAPDSIDKWAGGTADVMIESNIRLSMGLDVKQRVLAWSQPDHDDYVIWDLTFVNTGNVDADDEIELPDQILDSVYITKVNEAMINGTSDNQKVMPTFAGTTEPVPLDNRLSYPQDDDSLRIDYVAPLRAGNSSNDSYGFNIGANVWNIFTGARFGGNAVLFAPQSCDVPQTHPISDVAASNDPAQPSMHTSMLAEPSWVTLHDGILSDFPAMDSAEFVDAYKVMVMGVFGIDSTEPNFQATYYMDSVYNVYDVTATGAKTFYEQPLDRWGELDPSRGYAYFPDIPSTIRRFDQQTHWSIGPYQMGFGDTLRYVYAYVAGAVSRKNSYLAAEAWQSGQADSFNSWLAGLDSAQMVSELRQRDPIFNVYYDIGGLSPAPTVNDIAKDLLVASGRDSLFNNGMNAQRNFNMGYNIPKSPAPPSFFELTSMNTRIRLEWSYETGYEPSASELEKFRIYRALGGYVYEKVGPNITGDWQLIDSVDATETYLYEDTLVTPAEDYYYYITAVSPAGIESGKFLTMSKLPVRLQSAPGTDLDSIRIAPNPLNVNIYALGSYDDKRKITLFNLPAECTIHILTESGELVKKIEHAGGGTAYWDIAGTDQYLITDSDQYPASGIYIAYIETPDGQSISRKFVIVR